MNERNIDSSLEIVALDQDCHLDSDINAEDDIDNGDGNTDRTFSIFRITDPYPSANTQNVVINLGQISYNSSENDDDFLASEQLSLFEGESDCEIVVASDEEQEIVKAIREEITQMVVVEMKDELELLDKPLAIKSGKESLTFGNSVVGLDPRLKEEIHKMRKLDRILEKKVKQEKAVKRERIILGKQLKSELWHLLNEKKLISGDEKKNTERFLALELPLSHNAGICTDDDQVATESSCCSPVFPTQPPEIMTDKKPSNGKTYGRSNSLEKNSSNEIKTSDRSSMDERNSVDFNLETSSYVSSSTNIDHRRNSAEVYIGKKPSKSKRNAVERNYRSGHNKKNFIKRNIQLATGAQNIIAMTDEEKRRLEVLLADITEEDSDEILSAFQHADSQLMGNGCWLDMEDKERLDEIDSKLKLLLPTDDFESLTIVPPSYLLPGLEIPSNETENRLEMLLENDGLGEKVLRANKEERELKARLQEIDEQLSQLTLRPNTINMEREAPKLSEEQLQDLLANCARWMHSCSSNLSDSGQTIVSIKDIIYEHPHHLDAQTLHQLLVDAGSSRYQMSSATTSPNALGTGSDFSRYNKDIVSALSFVQDDSSLSLEGNITLPKCCHSTSSVQKDTISPECDVVHTVNQSELPSHLFWKRHIKINGHSANAPSPSISSLKPFLPRIDNNRNGHLVSRPASSQPRLSNGSQTSHRPSSSTTL